MNDTSEIRRRINVIEKFQANDTVSDSLVKLTARLCEWLIGVAQVIVIFWVRIIMIDSFRSLLQSQQSFLLSFRRSRTSFLYT
ncbi:unnamed protein product [Amoebophrya sp. A25]|nr:unnamed protein product [Amoebophrya sp. A25]|eukprot:GSA25T00017906001.1